MEALNTYMKALGLISLLLSGYLYNYRYFPGHETIPRLTSKAFDLKYSKTFLLAVPHKSITLIDESFASSSVKPCHCSKSACHLESINCGLSYQIHVSQYSEYHISLSQKMHRVPPCVKSILFLIFASYRLH